ncbi:CHAP domain-containing protein [Granulicatella adiacens]|uniref:CHAP domain-containing protein n=1 Tax=Granulicatella adiacens TaxID=46124 RepID=UPI0021A7E8CA|nr:CHAP domain-containing protein [Granulicatella adiacens]MCT2160062.1 CHAP domain-containing protein [Granulicatella adiacens]
MFTLRQAIGYVRNLADNNIGVNFDGWYGWQCWDLVAKVIYEATGKVVNGNAIDLLDSAKALGIEVVYEAPGVIAKAGDIFVMSVPGSPYGHTGVVIEDSDGVTLKTIEQNVDGNWDYLEVGGPARYRTRSYTGMVGYIRPNYATDSENVKRPSGWIEDEKGWWYRNDDGSYPKNKWEKINGSYFRFNNNGYALENTWYKDEQGLWYWLKSGGYMSVGWQQINGKWYYFNNLGEMQTGWIQYFDKWYYCTESNGDMVSKEARKIDGKYYYFNSNGEMLERAAVYVDENGVMHFEE